jgi:DtxR family Mn-dependent transcriptional regulator
MSGHSQTGKMTPSKENYLKVMLGLSNEEGIRSTDIASALGISKASVSHMMNVLRDEGYITKEKYGAVTLTESGKNVAVNIKRRYELLKRFFHNVLGVEADIAAEDACRVEHLISPETAEHIDRKLNELSGTGISKKQGLY